MLEICKMECEHRLRNCEINCADNGVPDISENIVFVFPAKRKLKIQKWISKNEGKLLKIRNRNKENIKKQKAKFNHILHKQMLHLTKELRKAKKYLSLLEVGKFTIDQKFALVSKVLRDQKNIYKIKIRVRIYPCYLNETYLSDEKPIAKKHSTIADNAFLLETIYQQYEDRYGVPPKL